MLTKVGQRLIEERCRMGMSTYVMGFRPPDEKWRQMKAIWDACIAAGIHVPTEVEKFFGGEPDEAGLEVPIQDAVKDWKGVAEEGFEVTLADLPPNITHIRFVNSW